jgi:hypothetical protein
MCTKVMVCHGDRAELIQKAGYTRAQLASVPDDHKPATYYITKDGQYAIDADFVSAHDLSAGIDLDKVPKIRLK